MACKRCDNSDCTRFYLFHEKELGLVDDIKKKEREECENVRFDFKESKSSGEIFNKFYELHVLQSVSPI